MRRGVRVVCLALLLAVPAPASAAGFKVSDPVEVSTPILDRSGDGKPGATASHGDELLVTWGMSDPGGQEGAAFAARIDGSGKVLDPDGIPLGELCCPIAAAWSGDQYLVLTRSQSRSTLTRISAQGSVKGQETLFTDGRAVRLAWGGSTGLILWLDPSLKTLRASRLSPNGSLLDPNGFFVGSVGASNYLADVRVAWSGSRFVVAWQEVVMVTATTSYGIIYARTIDGTTLGPDSEVWRSGTGARGTQGLYSLVAAGSTAFFSGQFPGGIVVKFPLNGSAPGAVVWQGPGQQTLMTASPAGGYEVASMSSYPKQGATLAHLSADGTQTAASSIEVPVDVYSYTSLGGSSSFALLLPNPPQGEPLLGYRLLNGVKFAEPPLRPTQLGVASQRPPAVLAHDGTNDPVAFSERRHGTWGIYAGRVGPNGERPDGSGTLVATEGSSPSITAGGGKFLVTYKDPAGDFQGRFLAPDTTPISPPFALGTRDLTQIVGGARSFLLLESTRRSLLAMDGTVAPWTALGGGQATAATNGLGFLVVFSKTTALTPGTPCQFYVYLPCLQPQGLSEIDGLRVDDDGVALGAATPVSPTAVEGRLTYLSSPKVVSNGLDFLVMWTRSSGYSSTIHLARVAPAGPTLGVPYPNTTPSPSYVWASGILAAAGRYFQYTRGLSSTDWSTTLFEVGPVGQTGPMTIIETESFPQVDSAGDCIAVVSARTLYASPYNGSTRLQMVLVAPVPTH